VIEAPLLQQRDIEEELKAIHAQERRSLTTALFGRVERELVVSVPLCTGAMATFKVIPVGSELAIRKALVEARGEPVALLVESEHLPLDITARLAHGKVLHIARSRRLANLLGARPTAELLASKLAGAVLREGHAYDVKSSGLAIDLDAAWRLFLQRHLGHQVEGSSDEAWVVLSARVTSADGLVQALARELGLRDELVAWLDQVFGPAAPIAFAALERGQAGLVPQIGFILDAALPRAKSDGYLLAKLEQLVTSIDDGVWTAGGLASPRVIAWSKLPERLNLRATDAEIARWVVAAERLVSPERAMGDLGDSTWLPVGFEARKLKLAEALAAVSHQPSREAALGSGAAYQELVRHQAAKADDQKKAVLQRALAAVRLGHWLAVRESSSVDDLPPVKDMVRLADEYVRDGGFVDWALGVARGSGADSLGKAIESIVARVEAARDGMDQRFARGLVDWSKTRRSSGHVVAIEDALERFGAAFLGEGSGRKLLVLLLDGMAWPNAVELLDSLKDRGYAPIQ